MRKKTRKVLIDFSKCNSKAEFHNEIKNSLNLPEWYGANLDALWDVLTGMIELPVDITVRYQPAEKPSKELITAFKRIADTFTDAAEEMEKITVTIDFEEEL